LIPVSILKRVDLPAPLWPRRHNNSFLGTSKYIPYTACTAPPGMQPKLYF